MFLIGGAACADKTTKTTCERDRTCRWHPFQGERSAILREHNPRFKQNLLWASQAEFEEVVGECRERDDVVIVSDDDGVVFSDDDDGGMDVAEDLRSGQDEAFERAMKYDLVRLTLERLDARRQAHEPKPSMAASKAILDAIKRRGISLQEMRDRSGSIREFLEERGFDQDTQDLAWALTVRDDPGSFELEEVKLAMAFIKRAAGAGKRELDQDEAPAQKRRKAFAEEAFA